MRKCALVLILALVCAVLSATGAVDETNPFVGIWDSVERTEKRICIRFYEDGTFRAIVLHARNRGYEYETARGRYEFDGKTGTLVLKPESHTMERYGSSTAMPTEPVKVQYAFSTVTDAEGADAAEKDVSKQTRTQLRLGKTTFMKDNRLSFEALLTKQREIQENLFLDTQI